MNRPLFIDDPTLADALDRATSSALEKLAEALPGLNGETALRVRNALRAELVEILTGHRGLNPLAFGEDAFGHAFNLEDLPLPRAACGYGVQRLDTDTLLDRRTGQFRPVREPEVDACFTSFDEARSAARAWVREHVPLIEDPSLAIVPLGFDPLLGRPILIFGVLPSAPGQPE